MLEFVKSGFLVFDPPLAVPGCTIIMIIIYALAPNYTHLPFTAPFRLFGTLIYLLGAKGAIESKREAEMAQQSPLPNSPGKIYEDGYFRYSRHPVYLSGCVALVGVAVMLPTFYNFLVPLLYVIVVDRFFISDEESTMKGLYDKDYVAYQGRVGRWMGRKHSIEDMTALVRQSSFDDLKSLIPGMK